MSLEDICENAKMAREYALLGNYDTSVIYYQSVLQGIAKHVSQDIDLQTKNRWRQVETTFKRCQSVLFISFLLRFVRN